MNILDAVSIRLPCNACGQTYEVPLRDVLLSHTVVRCGCPVAQETECPPVFQVRLFDREPIEALGSAWERLASSHSRLTRLPCCLPPTRQGVGILIWRFSKLNHPAHRCLRPTLRNSPRDGFRKTRGQDGVAFSFPVGLLHPLQHAGLSRRTTKNAQPVLLKNSTRSRPQGRNGDYSLKWISTAKYAQ